MYLFLIQWAYKYPSDLIWIGTRGQGAWKIK